MAVLGPLVLLPFFLLTFPSLSFATFAIPQSSRPYKIPSLSFPTLQSNRSYEIHYYTQLADHFAFHQTEATFQQRYLLNATYLGGAASGAPIFVMLGSEVDIEMLAGRHGFLFETAPYFKSLIVFAEHRYYGQSLPNPIVEANSTYLSLLSVSQALADYATLIVDLKKNLSAEQSPVIVFGGSYGGILAALFRLKYPHVVHGALASSAPLLLHVDLSPPGAYNDVATRTYRNESESCYRIIKNSWNEFASYQDQEKLFDFFKICRNVPVSKGIVVDWIQGTITSAAERDYPVAINPKGIPAYPVRKMCDAINNPKSGNDTFSRLYEAMSVFYNHTGDHACFDLTKLVPAGIGWGQYDYQVCAELITVSTGCGEDCILGPQSFNYSAFVDYCSLGPFGVTPRRKWFTTEFGGHDIKNVLKRFGSNIIFFNGLKDPWSAGGILESFSDSLIAIVAPEGAHCLDIIRSTEEDPKWLSDLRREERDIISKWLQEYNLDHRQT